MIWGQRWETCDVEVEGDDDAQLSLRSSIYHLLRCHVPDDSRVSIDAKGYAEDAYYGHFFWDTEMYMLPIYLYTDPQRAKYTSGIDLDIDHGGASQGIHIANAAATWMVAVMRFGGMKQATETDLFTLKPQLPSQWKSLRFRVTWKGIPLDIRLSEKKCIVINKGAIDICVRINNLEAVVKCGELSVFDLR